MTASTQRILATVAPPPSLELLADEPPPPGLERPRSAQTVGILQAIARLAEENGELRLGRWSRQALEVRPLDADAVEPSVAAGLAEQRYRAVPRRVELDFERYSHFFTAAELDAYSPQANKL